LLVFFWKFPQLPGNCADISDPRKKKSSWMLCSFNREFDRWPR
jgi:hypothetical protein